MENAGIRMEVFRCLTRLEVCKCQEASRLWYESAQGSVDSFAVYNGSLNIYAYCESVAVSVYNNDIDSGYNSHLRSTQERASQLSDVLRRAANFFFSSVTVEGDALNLSVANAFIDILSNLRNCTVDSISLSDCFAPDLSYELYVDLLRSCKTKKPFVEVRFELTTARTKEFVCRGLLKLDGVQSAKRVSIAVRDARKTVPGVSVPRELFAEASRALPTCQSFTVDSILSRDEGRIILTLLLDHILHANDIRGFPAKFEFSVLSHFPLPSPLADVEPTFRSVRLSDIRESTACDVYVVENSQAQDKFTVIIADDTLAPIHTVHIERGLRHVDEDCRPATAE